MTPTEIAKYAVAFGRQYETLTPGTVGYRGALIAHRNFLAEVMDKGFDGSENGAEVVAELQGLLKQAVGLHVTAGGQPVVVPALDGLACAIEGLGSLGRSGFLQRLRTRRRRRQAQRAGRRNRLRHGTANRQDVAEEQQDKIITGLRRSRSRFQQRGEQVARQQRARLVQRARRGGFGGRLARGLIRLGDRMKARMRRRRRGRR